MAGLINYTPTSNPQAVNQQLKPDPTPDQDQSARNLTQDTAQGNAFDRPIQAMPEEGMPKRGQAASPANPLTPPVERATAQQATATGWDIDPTTQTVAGQVQGLIQRGSPLMELSKTQAEQQMSARGLQNSSLGITAGQNAVYQAALPIAAQDASTYGRAAEFTAGAQNTASNLNAQLGTNVNLENAGASNTAANLAAQLTSAQKLQQMQNDTSLSVADKQAATQKYINDQNTETQRLLASEENALKVAMQNTDVASRAALQTSANNSAKELANIQADYQTLIRSDASASQAIADAAHARQAIMTHPTMTPDARISAFNMINNQLKAALNLHGSINGVDLTPLLDTFGGDATVVQTPTAPAAVPITTKTGVSFSSDDVKNYMTQNNFDMTNAGGFMQAMQKWNTDNPGKQISLDDLGQAYGMSPAQTAAWMKANPG